MVYRRSYNSNINPPAPFANLTITHPINKTDTYDVEALVDTGADVTLITKSVVENLHLIPNDFVNMHDYEGNFVGSKAKYLVGVSFGTFHFNIHAIETDGEPILGRDILNRLTTVLKGTAKQMEMS
ncbi:MAG: retropepsin-like aspartic protease [Nitrosotalea sp.]